MRPNRTVSYLTASVLYRVLTGRSPHRISFTAGLNREWARYLTELADYTIRLPQP